MLNLLLLQAMGSHNAHPQQQQGREVISNKLLLLPDVID